MDFLSDSEDGQRTSVAESPNMVTPSSCKSSGDNPTLTNASLEALQTSEHRELMDLVDRLRRAGLNSVLQLPQIVVCGDQSSGKSSVLEAITEIPFPRKENLCTRFATEIIMRRDAESSIICKINPDGGRSESEQIKLRKFSRNIKDFSELPSLIDDATAEMGLNEHRAFAKDVLSIEICGPNRPQLTLVDLPGLIHSANKSQSEGDVELIKSLVEDYISQKRTIILAVISAKNDYANQVILKICRRFDPKGARTLGVITKPDFLLPGSENERVWLDLAQNRDIYFELGWHLVKNRGDNEHHLSFAERNVNENIFLNSGRFKDLPQGMKGVDSLLKRSSNLLFHHLKRELPVLKEELDLMTEDVHMEIQSLGKSRRTLMEQRSFLADFFHAAYDIIKMGINGNYEDKFFGKVDIDAPIDCEKNPRRLRAVVQYLNIQFAERMNKHGHKYHIETSVERDSGGRESDCNSDNSERGAECLPPEHTGPLKLSREQAIERVVRMLERSRGREIPGTFNPMLISHLFWEQSESWIPIARDHIERVISTCKIFLRHVMEYIASQEIKHRLLELTVFPVLKKAREGAFGELSKIEEDKLRHPITYNHYFTDTLQKAQYELFSAGIKEISQKATVEIDEKTWSGGRGYEKKSYVEPGLFRGMLNQLLERDMDRFSAEQAVNANDAYYKAERKYFIDVVAKQVIERHLIAPLASIFSPKVLACYSDKQVHFLASESPKVVELREHLENKNKMLEGGQEAFRMAMGQKYDD
ncbi:interferon-induced GTP-binding protein Mx1 [Coccidioides immitis H538.4]|uniref:Interferon-induced GTP-binding protein Mx1 n=1 Tax=Coccidioides immitis H538.4 TaxID=396776 RepID=A0A0J8S2G4_COCIT|nr:interferon-induced GTP-binding protein Mx1 [Coccidioides immitis H538.4]